MIRKLASPLPTEEEYAEQLEAERQRVADLEAEIARLRASLPPGGANT